MSTDTALKDALHKMEQAVTHLKEDLSGIRTGRATPAVLNRVTVDYYGASRRSTSSRPSPRRSRAC